MFVQQSLKKLSIMQNNSILLNIKTMGNLLCGNSNFGSYHLIFQVNFLSVIRINLSAVIYMFNKFIIAILCLIPFSIYAKTEGKLTNTSSTLNKIFSYDIIDADLSYLESIIGIAKRTYDHEKEYSVNGCEVTVKYNTEKRITSMGLVISSKCNFNLNNFIQLNNQKYFPVNQLKFGQLNGEYYATCLSGICGNAADPVAYELYHGPRSQNFIEILITTDFSGNGNDIWSKAVIQNEGKEAYDNDDYNCNPQRYKSIAKKSLSELKATNIVIGYNLKSQELGYIEYHCNH